MRKGGSILRALAPGTYRLYAWAEPVTDVLADPEFLKRFAAKATQVTVGEGESAQADATLIKPGDATETVAASYCTRRRPRSFSTNSSKMASTSFR